LLRYGVTDASSATTPGGLGDRVAIAVALAVLTALFYVPVLDAGFLNWDDPAYVSQNPEIQRALSWHTVGWAFTTFQEGIWHPLTWLSLALDHAIYGLDARGFHLTNLLLHVANTVLVFVVWCRLTGAVGRAALVAALFGLHPMHVESVAWVTERKDVLSTCFWLLTILAYGRYARVRTPGAYLLVLAAFALGLLAKPMLVTLPFVLLLLDWWPLERLGRRAVLEKIPLLLLALAVIAVGIRAVAGVSADAVPDPIPLGARIANAIVATTKYLWLTIWPLRLSPWYSHPWFEGAPLSVAGVGGALLVLLALTAFALACARRTPAVLVGWLWFLGTLVPVLGLLYNGRQGMADRYAYIPHIGLFVAVVWLVADLPLWRAAPPRRAAAVAIATILLLLGGATAWQTRVWANDRTFWGYAVRANPDSFIAHQALGGILQAEGKPREAIALYRRALRIRPDLPKMHLALGRLLARTGQLGPAAAELRKGLALDPSSPKLHLALAQVSLAQRRRASARRHAEQTLELAPGDAEARQLLATLNAQG
jgi:protein O-mannosyl-transferase